MRISDWSSDVCSSDLKLDQPDQLVHRRALGAHRGRFLNAMLDTGALAGIIGCTPDDLTLYDLALTHGSTGRADYQRLEFLGGRVLGLVIASELYARFPHALTRSDNSRVGHDCVPTGTSWVLP